MKFAELGITGAWLITPEIITDARGAFRRHFCAEEFARRGIAATVAQGNVSENPEAGTLRGFHYQVAPYAEAKTLSCLAGAVHSIVVDLRAGSPTSMKWVAVDLSAADRHSLHVPAGCASAWLTRAPGTLVHYYMSAPYNAEAGRGFRYDDPAFGLRWPAPVRVISERDRSFPDFDPQALR
jgi:dTDP-4-dehydrorhamnose 3,5-epimerase